MGEKWKRKGAKSGQKSLKGRKGGTGELIRRDNGKKGKKSKRTTAGWVEQGRGNHYQGINKGKIKRKTTNNGKVKEILRTGEFQQNRPTNIPKKGKQNGRS